MNGTDTAGELRRVRAWDRSTDFRFALNGPSRCAGDTFPVTQRTKLKRLAKRAVYDRATVYSILDDTFVCHVGYTFEGQQFVMPQAFALDKQNEKLYFHGSITSRMLKTMKVSSSQLGHCM